MDAPLLRSVQIYPAFNVSDQTSPVCCAISDQRVVLQTSPAFGFAFRLLLRVLRDVVLEVCRCLALRVMPPRRRGRSRGLFQESGGQNEDQSSAPSHTLESSGEEEAAAPPAPVERMDVVIQASRSIKTQYMLQMM
ncbi:hypothetical protein F511_19738 [Dorcoceras hygrometricum]|uniref:Uncharacterized protein n=1 Tax=Dorcoceras hygrometricum TaxID=472368 RepID=A0A2Z7ADE4_9LAMI|nr:hypothetical protein F511_19738 [Dorcoceras hygrometricum]